MGKVRKAMPKAKEVKAPKAKLGQFIEKKNKDASKTKRDNTYVFQGFYERLKNIDVKHGHASLSLQNHMFDHLQDDEQGRSVQLESDDLTNSNFIQLLRAEKFKNHTAEFNKVFHDIENLCFSYPLLILNKTKVIQKLLHYMNDEEVKSAQATVFDLCIALIKDLRHEVYQEFLHEMLPKAIEVLDTENLEMMDKVFQLLSFAFKYLIKPIRENIKDVFSIYIVLLEHKNRYIRKFSAQSFSFVLRKITMDQAFTDYLLAFLDEEEAPISERINGLSQLLFEVVSGHSDELHSKGDAVLGVLFASERVIDSQACRQVIRILLLKIVNEIDVNKLAPIFEQLVTHLGKCDEPNRLQLLFKVFNTSVALKFGRRINQASVIVITQALNNLVQKQSVKLLELPQATRAELAETLGLLYYFKHSSVMQIFQKSKLDFASAKTAFTTGVFGLLDEADENCQVLIAFYSLLMQNPEAITAKVDDDLNVEKILQLKQSSQVIQFSEESHVEKARLLIKALATQTLKSLSRPQTPVKRVLVLIGLLVKMISISKETFTIDLPEKACQRIQQLQSEAALSDLEIYILAKFVKITKQMASLSSIFSLSPQEESKETQGFEASLDACKVVADNMVLRAYGEQLQKEKLLESVHLVMDLRNQGYANQVRQHTRVVLSDRQDHLSVVNCHDLLVLKSLKVTDKLQISDNRDLFLALNRNLSKNSIELRKATLKVLCDLFETESFLTDVEAKVDQEQIGKFYTGECKILPKLLQYENIPLAFDTERPREQILRKIEVQVSTGLVPHEYLDTIYHLMIGSLWLKFTPGYVPAMSLIQTILTLKPEEFTVRFLSLFESMGHITQFASAGEHKDFEDFFAANISQPKIKQAESGNNLFADIYLGDAVGRHEFILVKDFHFNLCKTLHPILDTILNNKDTKEILFEIFDRFYECEYLLLHQGRRKTITGENLDFKEAMVQANLVDSDEFKSQRKMSYGKLCAFVELFSKASQLKRLSPVHTEKLIGHLTRLLLSQESSLQKNVLTCLLKCSKKTESFKNTTAKLPKYAKLLEGLADDLKFRNVIPIINFGSSDSVSVTKAYDEQDEYEEKDEKQHEGKRSIKGNIPKLAQEDRQELLPFIIKLLFSKLMKKKGAINKNNSIGDRRNIVYIFLSSLDPNTEFRLFFKELLEPLDLSEIVDREVEDDYIKQKLMRVSFSQYTYFISTVEIIFKQLGTLLANNNYLSKLSHVLVNMLSLSKQFSGHLRDQADEGEDADDKESGTSMNRFVGKQSKMCLRKGLKIAKQLYRRFSYDAVFLDDLTEMLYEELVKDQLPLLKDRYISERSQLVEILTMGWSEHANCMVGYERYPAVLPSLIAMLQSSKITTENVRLILDMLKNIVQTSLEGDDKNKAQILTAKIVEDEAMVKQQDSQSDEDESMSDDSAKPQLQIANSDPKKTAQSILKHHVQSIGSNLHTFWTANQTKLKQALLSGGPSNSSKNSGAKVSHGQQMRERGMQIQVLGNLTFIVSELSVYLRPDQSSDALSFLTMIVTLISSKGIIDANSQNSGYVSSRQNRNEDLLVFGCHAITMLLKTLLTSSETKSLLTDQLLGRLLMMMLKMESKRARESFSEGLQNVLQDGAFLNAEVLLIIKDLNGMKKGTVDPTLDYEKVLSAFAKANKLIEAGLEARDTSALLFNVLNLLRSEEFAVRDYAQHSIAKLIETVDEPVFNACEKWMLTQIKTNTNELVIKSFLSTFKLFIAKAKSAAIKGSVAADLHPLIDTQKNEEDFFSQILSMQIQQRQKALRKLANTQSNIEAASFRKAVLPLVDYLIFDTKTQLQNRRNTIRYSREQSTQLMEDALNVYVSYAKRLTWPETFKLIRKLLFKIERAQRNAAQYSAEKEDTELEKTVTKSLCKVLEGLSLNESISLPDAILSIEEQAKEMDIERPGRARTEFTALLDELVGKAKETEGDLDEDEDEFDSDADDDDKDGDKEEAKATMDVIVVDKVMKDEDVDQKRMIQLKLQRKVLPVLQRHLFESVKVKATEDQHQKPIRSFVCVAIAKIIRKLPIRLFKSQLQKLINTIVVKGLRAGDLNVREKARKALLKVLGEVSPRFLQIIFNEMHDNLTKGYQLHVHLYTIHYLLDHLTKVGGVGEEDEQKLQPGQITSAMLHSISDLLMSELFGDLMEERTLTDTQKKHIKESKAGKALPIFQVLTEYIDFKKSFLDLLAPIVKILEENPNFVRIQQCEEVLNRISSQLLKNKTLNGDELLVFLYSIVERGIGMTVKTKVNDEKATRDYGAKVDNLFTKTSATKLMEQSHGIQMDWVKTHQQVSKKKTEEVCGRVLANFGLQCLRKSLKQKGLILVGDEHEQRALSTISIKQELKDKLDPFVLLFLRAFKTFYNPIIVTTLHILVNIVHLGLPSFKTLLKKFLNRIFKLFNQATSDDHEFLNTLFRCVTELIKTYSVYCDLSETQIKTLVQIIQEKVGSFNSQTQVFQCLKQIINRKFLCPDLYDLMETIEEMMVTSISRQTRSVCANIFVQFILEYPLEPARVQQHINHMLKNLTYYDRDGRLQLLEVFLVIVDRFPVQLLDNYAELFFFTLFLRLVNDENEKCREKVATVLKKLICKVSKSRQLLESAFKIGQQASEDNPTSDDLQKQESMLSGKLQLIQLFAESGKLTSADIERTVSFTSGIIAKHSKIATRQAQRRAKETDEIDELEINPVNADFLKGIDLGDSSEDEGDGNETDNQEMLEESQAKWSAAYLAISSLENLFQSCQPKQVISSFPQELGQNIVSLAWRHTNFWVKFVCQRLLGHMFATCLQMNNFASVFGSVFAERENLLKLIYQMLSVFNTVIMNEDMSNQLVKNLTFLQGQLLKKCASDKEDDTYVKTYKKASFIGRKLIGETNESTASKLEAIVQFFAVSVQMFATQPGSQDKIDNPFLRNCLGPMLELIHRTYSDEQMEQKVRDISSELVDLLSQNLEKGYFIAEFNRVKQDIQRNRLERKMKQKLLVGTQEGQQIKAKRRIAKTIRKKEKKTEKVLQYMMKKDA